MSQGTEIQDIPAYLRRLQAAQDEAEERARDAWEAEDWDGEIIPLSMESEPQGMPRNPKARKSPINPNQEPGHGDATQE